MSFQKVVKAPARRAHIKNYPHKKSKERDRRVKWLWEHMKTLISTILVYSGHHKMYYYTQLRETEQALKSLGYYDSTAVWCMIREVRLEHKMFHRW